MEDNDSSGGRDQDLLAQEVTGDRSQGERGEAWRDVILVLKACGSMCLNARARSPALSRGLRLKTSASSANTLLLQPVFFQPGLPPTCRHRRCGRVLTGPPGPAPLQGRRATGQEVTPATLQPAGGPGKVTSRGPVPAASTASQRQDGRRTNLRQIRRVSMREIYYCAKHVCEIHTSSHAAS